MIKNTIFTFSLLVLSAFSIYSLSKIDKVNAASSCIITISGIQYDVTTLQTNHSGGNVFVCGTDMTTLFMSMPTHAADLARLAPYVYIAPTSTPTPTVARTSTPTPTVAPTTTPVPSVSPTTTPTVSPTVSPSISPSPKHDDENEVEETEETNKLENHHSNKHHRNNPSIKAGSREHHEEK